MPLIDIDVYQAERATNPVVCLSEKKNGNRQRLRGNRQVERAESQEKAGKLFRRRGCFSELK